jgi:hypothetical protein
MPSNNKRSEIEASNDEECRPEAKRWKLATSATTTTSATSLRSESDTATPISNIRKGSKLLRLEIEGSYDEECGPEATRRKLTHASDTSDTNAAAIFCSTNATTIYSDTFLPTIPSSPPPPPSSSPPLPPPLSPPPSLPPSTHPPKSP